MQSNKEFGQPLRPRSRDEFEIAIICALPIEFHTVEAVLDRFWEDDEVYPKAQGDQNAYTIGRIGNHNVVLALMPGMGNSNSAGVAASFRSSFPNIKLGLVVGICGAVPTGRNGEEIFLGNVIISTGVVQIDLGRQYPDEMQRKNTIQDNLNPPNNELRTFLEKLASPRTRTLLRNNASHFLSDLQRKDESGKYQYPGVDKDMLYRQDYRHKHQEPSQCSICAQCSSIKDKVCDDARTEPCETAGCSVDGVTRNRLNRDGIAHPDFAVHFGLTASGNVVMKSGVHRDTIASRENVIAFEMEGAGVCNNFPTVVIKAACDYADSHKNKSWQGYAAATAAACMKAILKEWRLTDKAIFNPSSTELVRYQDNIYSDTCGTLVPREAWQLELADAEAWPTLLNRISEYKQEKAQRRLRRLRLEGTTDWFINHPVFQEFFNFSKTTSLWLCGTIGSGKTMICTKVIDHLVEQSTTTGDPVVYVYCDSSEPNTVCAISLLESLLKQVLEYLFRIKKECTTRTVNDINYFYSPRGPRPDLEDVLGMLSQVFPIVPQAWYVIDGFNEIKSEEISQTLSSLHWLFQSASKQKLLITSLAELGPNTKMSLKHQIRLSQSDTERDINRYIDSSLSWKMEHERVLTDNPKVIQLIRESLSAKAKGMFLWVHLQLQALWLDCSSDEDILRCLDNLPPDLPTTYERCLNRIPASDQMIAQRALRWVICATRALRIEELREAVGFDLKVQAWDDAKCPNRARLIGSCSNLISLDETDQSVHLVHHSVRQYLCGLHPSPPRSICIDEPRANLECGEECVNYLSFSDFGYQLQVYETIDVPMPSPTAVLSSLPFSRVTNKVSHFGFKKHKVPPLKHNISKSRETGQESTEGTKYAFLNYARHHWTDHTKKISNQSRMWHKFMTIALNANPLWNFHPWNLKSMSPGSHLHGVLAFASREGHIPLLAVLVNHAAKYRVQDFSNLPFVKDGLPALHAAARRGLDECVSLLLAICKVNGLDVKYNTALHHAAEKNHIDVASMLLQQKGAECNRMSSIYETPLVLAVRAGHEDMVSLLLSFKPELLPETPFSQNPVVIAASLGHTAIFQKLFSVRRKIKEPLRLEALADAVRNGRTSIVSLLLKHNIGHLDRESKIYHGGYALQKAVQFSQKPILEQLLKLDISVNWTHPNFDGASALLTATKSGHLDIIDTLLQRVDIDVNKGNRNGTTPLMLAVANRQDLAVKMLLQKTSLDVNLMDLAGQTALMFGVANSFSHFLDLNELTILEPWGVFPPYMDTPAFGPSDEVVDLLLKRKDLEINDCFYKNGYTILAAAILEASMRTVNLLLGRHDIDANLPNSINGRSPLITAVMNRNEDYVRLLLERPEVRVNIEDSDGKTALWWAVEFDQQEIVRTILDLRGFRSKSHDLVDLEVRSQSGETVLTHAATYSLDIHQLLIEEQFIREQAIEEGEKELQRGI